MIRLKGIFIIYVLLVSVTLPKLSAQEVKVDFRVENYPDSIAYVGYYFGNQKFVLDTLEIIDDSFTLITTEAKPGLHFIYTPSYFQEFVMDGGSFSLKTKTGSMYEDLNVKGSEENELFRDFQVTLGGLQRRQQALAKEFQEASSEDSIEIRNELKVINARMNDFRNTIKEDYPESFMAAFIGLMEDVDVPDFKHIVNTEDRRKQKYFYYKKHYFDQVDLQDERLLRTPILHQKVMKYFDQLVSNNPDSLKRELDWFFSQVGDNQESFRYWLVTFFKKYTESKVMGMDAVMIHLIENYYLTDKADWTTEEYQKKLREEVAYIKPNLIGKPAPPLHVVDTLQNPFILREVKSPYTLLFIYDPDCGHCKKSIKELENHDNELTQKNIQVVAVCTTTDMGRWMEFVRQSNPTWVHAIDPTGKSYFRVSYNVRSTPKIYLLDKDKVIIGKQLDTEQILDLVDRLDQAP